MYPTAALKDGFAPSIMSEARSTTALPASRVAVAAVAAWRDAHCAHVSPDSASGAVAGDEGTGGASKIGSELGAAILKGGV